MASSESSSSSASSSPKRMKKEETDEIPASEFPVDKTNPFEAPFCDSDVVLIVEGKKLHVHRSFLSVYSPYFRVLLGSQHFAEAREKEIDLNDNESVPLKYDTMVKFLLQLYPVHSGNPIADDLMLSQLFPLADYFQCIHVRNKCEKYIKREVDSNGRISAQSALLYLRLCVCYEVQQFVQSLKDTIARYRLREIQCYTDWKSLTPEIQRDIFQDRISLLENRFCVQSYIL